MSEPFLRVKGLTKRFGAVMAMAGVDLSVERGEIVALLGDNGAGKSTLIKCVSGVHRPDSGSMELDGQPASLRTPTDARKLGIETVYQDLALFDNLDTVSNFYAGRELQWPSGRLLPRGMGIGRKALMRQRTREALDALQVHVKGHTTPVGLLSGGQRQAIAVARAVSFASRLVILDEPTAALGVRESQNVIELIRRLPGQGIAVLLISHNLDHVAQLADRAVVLRQGSRIGEAVPNAENHERLVQMIVGANPPGVGRMERSHEER
jgi:ABC-type sugar transport system ATPase subunit